MIATQRYENIVKMVNERGAVSTGELARALNVTETTIRRDCENLEKQGALVRVHGGAKSIENRGILSSYRDKAMRERTEHYEEKEIICRKAAELVREGDCVYLDSGTTMVSMLKYLRGKRLKIVTPSLLIAEAFQDPESELIVTGGRFMLDYDMMAGPIAADYLTRFSFDHAFFGCSGLDIKNGLVYTSEVETMSVKECAMKCALKKYLLIDASKLFVKGFYGVLRTADFDGIFYNENALTNSLEFPENFVAVSEES